MKHNLLFILILGITLISLTGCGKEDQALNTYKEEMTTFCNDIQEQSDVINAIDPASESAAEELLAGLDTLNQKFTYLADMEVPKQFASIESLADEAGSYMADAVTMYHEAFEAEKFDSVTLESANENYERAIKRVQYIGDILMGKVPDGADVTVEDEETETSSSEDSTTETTAPENTDNDKTEDTTSEVSTEEVVG